MAQNQFVEECIRFYYCRKHPRQTTHVVHTFFFKLYIPKQYRKKTIKLNSAKCTYGAFRIVLWNAIEPDPFREYVLLVHTPTHITRKEGLSLKPLIGGYAHCHLERTSIEWSRQCRRLQLNIPFGNQERFQSSLSLTAVVCDSFPFVQWRRCSHWQTSQSYANERSEINGP